MKVGIPGELKEGELRVGATPKTVKRLIKQGFDVSIEKGAGRAANYSDESYKKLEHQLQIQPQTSISDSDIILKVQAVDRCENRYDERRSSNIKLSYPGQNPELFKN